MIDLELRSERVRFSDAKHYLGPLCIRAHEFLSTGQSWRHRGHDNCVECTRERARSWRVENPERAAANTRRRDAKRVKDGDRRGGRQRYPFAVYLGSIRARAREKHVGCDLTPDHLRRLWIEQDGRCFWTGVPIDFFVGGHRHPFRPSLDRLYPTAGYMRDNVVWSSNFANRARGELAAEGFVEVLKTLGLCKEYDLKLAAAHRKYRKASAA